MGWVIAISFVIAAVYLLGRAGSKDPGGGSREVSSLRPGRVRRTGDRRTPTYTNQRPLRPSANLGGATPSRRELPFAEPGMKGRLFAYGGCRVRGGSEHLGSYAVIDVETTGLSPRRDRVVEVAIARVSASGQVEDEFSTLINPQGHDVGPTFIHGITNEQVRRAPTFAEIAPELLERMAGGVIVAHNATFEEGFLANEFERAGIAVATMPALCTLWLGRQTFATPNHKLGTLARAGGVPLVDKHAALGDVRAVAALLPQMTARLGAPLLYLTTPLVWRRPPGQISPAVITRAVALRKGADGWMQSLVTRLPASGMPVDNAATEAYLDALAEVLSDGKLTGDEAKLLARHAGTAGMGGEQVLSLNRQFLESMKLAALDDEVLTAAEIRHLRVAAKALSLPDHFGNLQPNPASPTAPRSTPAANGVSAMTARAERGVHALELQRSGTSRAEIAGLLRVSQETVKGLLRDAKFYENPLSDPSRLALARDAHAARQSGHTRDRFQTMCGLTPGKGTETWRDAAMLESLLSAES